MDNVSATIRSVLLTDPRTSQLSPAQIDTLVSQLSRRAAAQRIDSHAILWRPIIMVPNNSNNPNGGPVANQSTFSTDNGNTVIDYASCGTQPAFICNVNKAFGLPGSSALIPVTSGVLGVLLLALAAFVIEMRHRAR